MAQFGCPQGWTLGGGAHPLLGQPTVSFHRDSLPPVRACPRACSWKLLPKGCASPVAEEGVRLRESHSGGRKPPLLACGPEVLFRHSLNTSFGSALDRVVKSLGFVHLPGDLPSHMACDGQRWGRKPRASGCRAGSHRLGRAT